MKVRVFLFSFVVFLSVEICFVVSMVGKWWFVRIGVSVDCKLFVSWVKVV